jgi:hypothetical protein
MLPGDEKATVPGPKDQAPANPAPGVPSPSPTANPTNNPGASGAPKAP